jgi:hypothetical protein
MMPCLTLGIMLASFAIACRVAPGALSPEGRCAADHDQAELFALMVRRTYRQPAGADAAGWPRPEQIVAIYDDRLCAQAVQAWRAEDHPVDSLQRGVARRASSLSAASFGCRKIVQAHCSYHVLTRQPHHAGMHLDACM